MNCFCLSINLEGKELLLASIAEKSFSLNPKFNFSRHEFVLLENKNCRTNNMKKNGSKNLPLEFLKFVKMQLLQLSENLENHKDS